ncbi:enoyl-CoA hydratase-related protein [Blastococcus sp. CT_GayMR16]|uniref:enoyl-CoA hydratase/isomerase family protein n=1 Tax=Blastococcus sp. CT_GayMR16 TaxID=2559607 RepID=UPI0010746CFA|nr:enoyl-CoA hydratase-related protein [Blastococcus sp. CT_GayMR16]TFV88889.1 enoyl-CoA hydratase [Blastococcus sp. CT_GayMR16]
MADVEVRRDGAVATVTFNRPDRLNAMTGESFDLLRAELEVLAADDAVRAVVLTGAGRGFCAGGDLSTLAGSNEPGDAADLEATMARLTRNATLLREMPKPTIAAINGPCAGAGLSLACACDLRYAAEGAVFKSAFLSAGVPGDYGGTWTLPRVVGPAMARQLYLADERIDAATALRIGLVGAVVPAEALLPAVAVLAERLAAAPAHVVRAMKANFNDADDLDLPAHLVRESARFVEARLTR